MARSLAVAAYTAGIIDGEGSISMTRVGGEAKSRSTYWRIVVSVSNCYEPLIDWLIREWAGSALRGIDRGGTRRVQHRWTVVGNQARAVLLESRPYLLQKGERADWAMEVLDLQAAHQPGTWYTDAERARLLELRSRFDQDKNRSDAARGRVYLGGGHSNG